MAKLKSEIELTCPCCQATLVFDPNLGRIVSHKEPDRGNKPELTEAQRILAEEAARREAIFQQSVDAEKTRGDALSRRFEEALKQARQEPITKPTRDFRPPLPSSIVERLGHWVARLERLVSLPESPEPRLGHRERTVWVVEERSFDLPHVGFGQPPVVRLEDSEIHHRVCRDPTRQVD